MLIITTNYPQHNDPLWGLIAIHDSLGWIDLTTPIRLSSRHACERLPDDVWPARPTRHPFLQGRGVPHGGLAAVPCHSAVAGDGGGTGRGAPSGARARAGSFSARDVGQRPCHAISSAPPPPLWAAAWRWVARAAGGRTPGPAPPLLLQFRTPVAARRAQTSRRRTGVPLRGGDEGGEVWADSRPARASLGRRDGARRDGARPEGGLFPMIWKGCAPK